ncbi:TonB-dependent receptor [Gilvibacter sp. SZ-19]|uniref:TonB-dependent receptor n=1 Tax=Gilvibacter sp. SZ-19 TaxID=754429 RepID=UPI000B3CF659|nr:TonB-dependent receptor [Gilvibacter sp. SZ-19]ARV12854.1 TonB-dependent receptor [Gilvibacter sp. SZ-19]
MDFKSLSTYLVVFFSFCCVSATFGQLRLEVQVNDEQGQAVIDAEVYLNPAVESGLTDVNGQVVFEDLEPGDYQLYVFALDYELLEATISLNANKTLTYVLEPLGEALSEVIITAQRETVLALRQLRPVEGTAIYSGKKSEVVLLDNVTANLATANARQIYSRIVGLNIYENNDAGLQLNIGGRGLNPNRTANFNTRQNGYDISADVLGYPESYYSPPPEAVQEIQIVRGAASLQYGTQFGGLVNFKMREPEKDKPIALVSRQTLGAYNLFTSFNSLSGTLGKFSYYSYFNYKSGEDFRPNSDFESYNAFGLLRYKPSNRTTITAEFSYLNYLAQQAGGLTDSQFQEDPSFSNRTRNFFKIDWKLYSLKWEQAIAQRSQFSLNLFALDASRKAVGFRENRVSQVDDLDAPRELIIGNFRNWGAEARFLSRYDAFGQEQTFLIGGKYYQSNNAERQGPGTNGLDADFNFADEEFPNYARQSDFDLPNLNVAVFAEHILKLNEKLSITPGARFEYIKTEIDGSFERINFDLAGNPILQETVPDMRSVDRSFVLLGLGASYKATDALEFYGNISQNYRSVTFSDIRITNPSLTIDPNISDESGFTADIGLRGRIKNSFSFDAGLFLLSYQDRLGLVLRAVSDIQQAQFRGNIGDAITYGFEGFGEYNLVPALGLGKEYRLSVFANLALTRSEYTRSELNNVVGNQVEFVPDVNLKTGLSMGYKNFLASLQYTYLSEQFTDATNSRADLDSQSGIVGEIPAYDILDFSARYRFKSWLQVEGGINNLLDNNYFVRRATGYPGPGIIPSQPRTWYAGLEFRF